MDQRLTAHKRWTAHEGSSTMLGSGRRHWLRRFRHDSWWCHGSFQNSGVGEQTTGAALDVFLLVLVALLLWFRVVLLLLE